MELSLEALGLSKEDVAERVIERIAEQMLSSYDQDDDGEKVERPSRFKEMLQKRIIERVNQSIDEIAAKHVLPNVTGYLENLCLQETNQWGEKKGAKVTFTEYLVQRAHAYMTEDVNYEGKSKAEVGSYSWSKSTTRIASLVHKHLDYHIKDAMTKALATANSAIVGGLEAAVKTGLSQALAGLKVDVKTK